MNALEALRAIQTALDTASIDEVPSGWMTAVQWAEAWSKSRPYAGDLLKRGVDRGVVDVRAFRIRTGSRVYPVPHYRMKAKKR